VHVYVVARLGDLECVGSPHGSNAYSLEVVRSTERGKPPWAEGKEDCGRVAEGHTARDAEGSTSSADGDRGHVTEQELELALTGPDDLQAGCRSDPSRLLEEVDNTQPKVGTALAQSRSRAEQVIRDLLSDG
jgi:hypothetical protein